MDVENEEIAKDVHIEDFHKPKTCLHTFIFDSEFVSIDNAGNVLVLSLPQLPLKSISQRHEGSNMASAYHSIDNYKDHEENLVEGQDDASHPRSQEVENAHKLSTDFIDIDLSPRLTNFIKSGIVPESPVHNSGSYLQKLFSPFPSSV